MYNNKNILRKELVIIGRKIAEEKLVIGPGGNTSARLIKNSKNIIYMKASGTAFETAKETDYVGVDLQTGKVIDGNLKPTSEINMHLLCYKLRKDINAVIHTHPVYSTAYAMRGKSLKGFTPDFVALVDMEVPVMKYVIPTGKELADEVGKFIRNYNAVLLANHGLLTVGANLKEAFYRTLMIEIAIKTFFISKLLGRIKIYTKKEAMAIKNLSAEKYRVELLKKQK